MASEFRCEKCGAMVRTDAEAGATVRCSNCKRKVPVPAAGVLASRSLAAGELPSAPQGGGEPAEREPAVFGAMARVMPWVISLLFHVGLGLILMLAAMFVVRQDAVPAEALPRMTLAHGQRMPRRRAGRRGPKRLPLRRPPHYRTAAPGGSNKPMPQDPGDTNKAVSLVIGRASRKGSSDGPRGLGRGWRLFGTTDGRDPYGSGDDDGLPAARNIVYVIDRSGSMVETFDTVRAEMLRSIGRLRDDQWFHVILFARGAPMECGARALVPANRRYKEQAALFLDDVNPGGSTHPVAALERAFAVLRRADRRRAGKLIFFLTDGNFPDNAAVLAAARKLNRDREVVIHTYLYGKRPAEAVRVMRKIADESGGIYRYISGE